MSSDSTPEWTRATVEQFYAVRRGIPALRQRSFDDHGRRGWQLSYQGDPVAYWYAHGLTNEVAIRVR